MESGNRQKLVSALSACPSIQDGGTRDAIISYLPDDVRSKIIGHDSERTHVTNIVRACSTYKNGIEVLVQSLYHQEGKDSIPMQDVLDTIIDIFEFGDLLDREYYIRLLSIALYISVPFKELQTIYEESRPTTFVSTCLTTGLFSFLACLSKTPPAQSDAPRPLLSFVTRLAGATENTTIANQLNDWIDEVTAQLREPSVATAPSSASLAEDATTALLVKIEPHPHNRNHDKQKFFFVHIYFWHEQNGIVCWHQDDKERPLNTVPQLLAETLAEHVERLNTIEFFLPHDLLEHAVEQWEIDMGFMPTTIGGEYPVVIRSLDRIKNQNRQLYTRWQDRWKALNSQIVPEINEQFSWICDHEQYDHKSFYQKLRVEDKPCLGLTVKPAAYLYQINFFRAILQAALPVTVWPRPNNVSNHIGDIQQAVTKIVTEVGLSQLPHALLQARRQAAGENDPAHPGNYLALLWDDPNKLPPWSGAK